MAVAPTVVRRTSTGQQRRRVVDITFDSSYPTGGEPVTPATFGLTKVDTVEFSHATTGAAYSSDQVRYDSVNSKLLVYTVAGVEKTNLTDLSTFKARLVVSGR